MREKLLRVRTSDFDGEAIIYRLTYKLQLETLNRPHNVELIFGG